jgi:hypothetical protein
MALQEILFKLQASWRHANVVEAYPPRTMDSFAYPFLDSKNLREVFTLLAMFLGEPLSKNPQNPRITGSVANHSLGF